MKSETTVDEEFRMDHLANDIPDTTEELKKEVSEKAEEEEPPKEDPKTQKEYTFQFKWVEPGTNKVFAGEFTNKILNIKTRSRVGVMRARLAQGQPLEALDELTAEINLMVAHMSFSLEKVPEWANDLGSLTSFRLLQEIYGEVLAHEATFHGYTEDKEAS